MADGVREEIVAGDVTDAGEDFSGGDGVAGGGDVVDAHDVAGTVGEESDGGGRGRIPARGLRPVMAPRKSFRDSAEEDGPAEVAYDVDRPQQLDGLVRCR